MKPETDPRQPDFADLSARVYRLCLALLGDGTDAGDAAQESLSRAWSGRGRKRDGVSWWTWTGGFAVRVCREMRRGRAVRAKVRSLDGIAYPPQGKRQEARGKRDREEGRGLHEAIMALPDRQREVTVLRLLVGLSTERAARMLGCPEGTIKSNLHKALSNLRAKMDESGLADEVRGV